MMRYKGYIASVQFDPDARILHGEVAGIRDVVTFQGESVAAVEKAFRDSVDDYLAFCKQRGEQPDKPFSGQFVLRVDAGLHRSLNMLAHASGQSLNTFVATCLQELAQNYISQPEPIKPAKSHQTAKRSSKSNGHRHSHSSKPSRQAKIPA